MSAVSGSSGSKSNVSGAVTTSSGDFGVPPHVSLSDLEHAAANKANTNNKKTNDLPFLISSTFFMYFQRIESTKTTFVNCVKYNTNDKLCPNCELKIQL